MLHLRDGELQLEKDLLLIKTMKQRWTAPGRRRLGTGQRRRNDTATVKDALIKLSKEECVGGTVQNSNCAAVKDAKIFPSKEECAKGMGQRSNSATAKDA